MKLDRTESSTHTNGHPQISACEGVIEMNLHRLGACCSGQLAMLLN